MLLQYLSNVQQDAGHDNFGVRYHRSPASHTMPTTYLESHGPAKSRSCEKLKEEPPDIGIATSKNAFKREGKRTMHLSSCPIVLD